MSPRREGPVVPMEGLPLAERLAWPADCQLHWYRHAAGLAVAAGCRTALDVGAGHGLGLDVLRDAGLDATGIDPLPLRDDIATWGVSESAHLAFDVVLACDVIEHVEDDLTFLRDLLRAARVGVWISTPNWLVSQAANPHHVREYTPPELATLLRAAGARAWHGWTSGPERRVVPLRTLDEAINNFGVWIPCASS